MTVVFGFDALVKKIRFFLSLYFNVKLYILIKGPLALTIWTKYLAYMKIASLTTNKLYKLAFHAIQKYF